MGDILNIIPASHLSNRELLIMVDKEINSLRSTLRDWERHECDDCDCDDFGELAEIQSEIRGVINTLEGLL